MNDELLATEMIKERQKISKAKDIAIISLTIAITAITIALSVINYRNDHEWRKLFASYDFVSQDGEGINNINTGEQGDLGND